MTYNKRDNNTQVYSVLF